MRGYEDEEERPRKDRPAPGPRKHVSVLRSEPVKGGNAKTQRRRIERASTEDRKGRSIDVERIVAPKRGKSAAGVEGSRKARRTLPTARTPP